MLKILFFGALGDKAGSESKSLELASGNTPEALRETLARDNPELGWALAEPQVMVAVNQALADWQTPLADGDEVAFLPPVTGG